MHSDENSEIFGDARSDTHAASTPPAGTPGAPSANRGSIEMPRRAHPRGRGPGRAHRHPARGGVAPGLEPRPRHVLQEAADSAHTLTHARCSLIVTVDEACELVIASGRRRRSTATRGASRRTPQESSGGTCPAWSPPLPRYAVGPRLAVSGDAAMAAALACTDATDFRRRIRERRGRRGRHGTGVPSTGQTRESGGGRSAG